METHRLRELLAINRSIAETLDYEALLELVVDRMCHLTGADQCALLLADESGEAYLAAHRGLDAERAAAFSAPFDEKIEGALRKLVEYRPDDTFIGVPVIRSGSVRGILLAVHRGPVEARAEEEELLSALADQAAIALEHAGRYRELWRESQAARRELETASRRKDEFLAMLAHELRNPLAAIVNALALLEIRVTEDDRAIRLQEIASRQAMHMKRLLDDLLDVSRVAQGRVVLERRIVDLRELVSQAIHAARPLLDERRHHLEVVLPDEPARVDADPDRLVEVVSNLLANAAKYSPPGGHVRLELGGDEETVELRVADRGVGIPPELLPSVFDLFVQSDQGYPRSAGGLGIGLTLVRRLVEMHDGEVEAHSEGEGRGSEFVVRLPRVAAPQPAPAETPEPVAHSRSRRVLVVEDNADVGEMLASLVATQGHRVTLVGDGESALRRLDEEVPEVMLVDIGLPSLDGYEVARRVRARAGRRPLLVAVTGYGTREDRERSREAGFDHHLVKPVEPGELDRILGAA